MDGMFSGNEVTPEQEVAMNNLIHDTGRNFSFITCFIFALFLAVPTYVGRKNF